MELARKSLITKKSKINYYKVDIHLSKGLVLKSITRTARNLKELRFRINREIYLNRTSILQGIDYEILKYSKKSWSDLYVRFTALS